MKKFIQGSIFFLAASISEVVSASSGAYLAGRQAITDQNFVTASKFQTKSVSADPSNSKLLEGLMISLIAQGSVDNAISIAEGYRDNGNLSQIFQMVQSASLIKDGKTEAFLNFVKDASEITPILKDLLSAWILMGLNDEVNANLIFDETAKWLQENPDKGDVEEVKPIKDASINNKGEVVPIKKTTGNYLQQIN